MSVNTDPKAVDEVLSRGVEEVIVKEKLRERMLSGEVLRIKLGIDPTSPNLHIGRSVPLLKLRDFQELGHQIVLIVGDFTGVIGDTSDKESERPMLEKEKVEENLKNYVTQAGKIIDIEKCEVHRNSEWLGKLSYGEIGVQADQFSLAEFISRENIRRRLDAGTRVSLRELLYPLMQGYDSVEIKADVEVGGTDQRFNLLAGRNLQEYYKQRPQNIIMNPLIEGTDGRKMSSSWGNTINLTAEPDDMFGKVMSISDDLIIKYFTFVTRVSTDKVKSYEENLHSGSNPRDIKADLAFEIVKMYHSETAAQQAQENFDKMFRDKEIPDEIVEHKLSNSPMSILDVLVETGFAPSKGEARRLVDGGGVKMNGEVVSSYETMVESTSDGVLIQKGKRGFVKVF
ncbi:MAG: tyrosine--tRNA ligase [Candidatus Uhrbacteria bacterium]